MKKILGGFFCAMLMITGANAENIIRAATTNTVRHKVYDINYGRTQAEGGTLDGRGYRQGVVPQTNELNTARGNTSSDVDSVTVGYLAAAATAAPSGSTGYSGTPTETVTANSANIKVLQRDKLVTPGSGGNCTTGVPCGYVTTGGHTNNPVGTTGFVSGQNDRVWLKIEGATVNGQTYYGNLPSGN